MGTKPFRFHSEAREEFRGAIRWYRAHSSLVSSDFRQVASEAIRTVSEGPDRWPRYLHGTRRFVIQRFPFSIVYLDEADSITIIAVAHGKRRPGYWKQRV